MHPYSGGVVLSFFEGSGRVIPGTGLFEGDMGWWLSCIGSLRVKATSELGGRVWGN